MIDINKTTKEEQDIITSSKDIKDIFSKLVEMYINLGKPFTSGEMTAKIRKFNPDVNFSAKKLGEKLRLAFQNGDFSMHKFMQFSRSSQDGRTIYVYAPNRWSGENYDFEVEKDLMSVPQSSFDYKDNTFVKTNKSVAKVEKLFTVTIDKSGRICFPKSTVKKIQEIQGMVSKKDSVYFSFVKKDSGLVVASLAKNHGFALFKMVEKDGRVRFKSPMMDISKKGSGTHIVKESELFV